MTTRPAGIWRPARPAQRLREERGGMAVGGQVAGEHLLRLRGGGMYRWFSRKGGLGLLHFLTVLFRLKEPHTRSVAQLLFAVLNETMPMRLFGKKWNFSECLTSF